jgi:hypothetical protein
MRDRIIHRTVAYSTLALALHAVGCSKSREEGVGKATSALVAACFPGDGGDLPPEAWVCPNPRRMECVANQQIVPTDVIFVAPSDGLTCGEMDLNVAPGPFPVGTHQVVVTDTAHGAPREVCRADLTVVDTTPPVVSARTVELWPPNHKMHALDIRDCLTANDACDPLPEARVLWVSGDEAVDDLGDGNTEPDALFTGCSTVSLRAERSGKGDGRVYEVGFAVTDASGNSAEGVCRVVVPHDQGHGDAGSGTPAWRLTAPNCEP